MNIFILYYFLGINLIAYAIYLIDKRQAIKNNYRISENILLATVAIGGTFGALLSMIINRHKIKKFTFIIKYLAANILFIFLAYRIFQDYENTLLYFN